MTTPDVPPIALKAHALDCEFIQSDNPWAPCTCGFGRPGVIEVGATPVPPIALAGEPDALIRHVLVSLDCAAQWLENGCDPKCAAGEIRLNMAHLQPLLSPTPSTKAAGEPETVGAACIEKLRALMVRLGVYPGDGLEWFAANIESNLYSVICATNKLCDSIAAPTPSASSVPVALIGYIAANELDRVRSGHDANMRSARFGPSPLDGDVPVYLDEPSLTNHERIELYELRGALEFAAPPASPAPSVLTDAFVDEVMEQAQVFASAWSMVGGPFDFGDALKTAEAEKVNLRAILQANGATK